MNFNEEHEKLLLERKELYNEKREIGPYGGLFRTCKNCGIEK